MFTEPTTTAEPTYPVKRIKTGEAFKALSLADRWCGAPTHFLERSLLCPGQPHCPLCTRGEKQDWTAILPVRVPGGHTALLAITQGLARSIEQQMDNAELLHAVIEIHYRSKFTGARLTKWTKYEGPEPEEWSQEMIQAQLARLLCLPRRRCDQSSLDWQRQCIQTAVNQIERKITQ